MIYNEPLTPALTRRAFAASGALRPFRGERRRWRVEAGFTDGKYSSCSAYFALTNRLVILSYTTPGFMGKQIVRNDPEQTVEREI